MRMAGDAGCGVCLECSLCSDATTKLILTCIMMQFPHKVQQVMSAESHPTLSSTIPAFKMFIPTWEKLIKENPHMEPLVSQGLEWAQMYYA